MSTARPSRRELGDERLEPRGARRVEAGEGLVEEQHAGVLHERAGDEHALALAAGERAERAPRPGRRGRPRRAPPARPSRSARPARRHHGRPATVPMSATSRAETGKSSRERSVCGTTRAPRRALEPPAGASSPVRTRKSVVLPPPFGPRTPIRSPAAAVNETPGDGIAAGRVAGGDAVEGEEGRVSSAASRRRPKPAPWRRRWRAPSRGRSRRGSPPGRACRRRG